MYCSCFVTEEEKTQKRNNDEIEKQLKKESLLYFMEEKILLLGAAASGKSTIIKQMNIIHGNGYNEEDKKKFISLIHQNVFAAIKSLIEAMQTFEVEYENEDTCEVYIEELDEIVHDEIDTLSDDNFEAIEYLWQDKGIQNVYRKRNLFHLIDSAKYYLDIIDKIRDCTYLPSEDDILHARVPSRGIVDYSFNFGGINIKMTDVGGQRSERRKWIHSFEKVSSILFIVALSEYDEKPIEDHSFDNRLNETKHLFKSILSLECLQNPSLILFFNKIDIFESKIQYSDLGEYFTDYNGPKRDADRAKQFITDIFINCYPFKETKTIYPHYTCATDTKNIKVVFDSLKNTVLKKNLGDIIG